MNSFVEITTKKPLSTHGLKIDTNLIFDDFLKSNYGKNTVWMDSKNLNNVNNCNYAKNWLNKYSNKFESLLIEIPTSSLDSINEEYRYLIEFEFLQALNILNNFLL